jgi:predicted methyltransferase
MSHSMHRVVLLALLSTCFVGISRVASAEDFAATRVKVEAALAADDRPEKDVIRDKNRKPAETLEFFGLRDDMKVVEMLPGGGWYTRVLAPVLRENGDLSVAYGTGSVEEKVLTSAGFDKVKVTGQDAKVYRPEDKGLYTLENADLEVRKADMVLTFRNYHNFDAAGRKAMNDAAFVALREGGIYGIVDHTRRHMEDDSSENRRRFDPVKAIKEIQSAGFELLDFASLHFRADDELRYEVGRRTVSGNTDRWTLKFKKVSN